LFDQGGPVFGLRMRPLAATIAVAILYFLAARLGLALLAKPDGVAVFWPAAGIASGILIAFGSAARWPVIVGVMAATVGANLLGDRNIPSSLFFAVANAAEASLIAGLIHHFFGAQFELDKLPRVLGLFVATIAGTMISGIIGTLGFILFHSSAVPIPIIWLHWFTSDSLGTITLAPLVIGTLSLVREFPPKREYMEGALALTMIFVLCALLVFLPKQPWILELAIASLCPLLLWIAARLRPVFTAAAIFVWAFAIVWTTTFGIGTFGDANLQVEQRIMSAQATILAASLGALVLAALFSERRLHEAQLVEGEMRLQAALRAGRVVAFEWDAQTDKVRYSQNVSQIGGATRSKLSAGLRCTVTSIPMIFPS
jgi:integral membrane sensor domain MASE1